MIKRSRRYVESFEHKEIRMLLSLLEKDILFSREMMGNLVDEWREIYVHRYDNGTKLHTKLLNMYRQTNPAARGK